MSFFYFQLRLKVVCVTTMGKPKSNASSSNDGTGKSVLSKDSDDGATSRKKSSAASSAASASSSTAPSSNSKKSSGMFGESKKSNPKSIEDQFHGKSRPKSADRVKSKDAGKSVKTKSKSSATGQKHHSKSKESAAKKVSKSKDKVGTDKKKEKKDKKKRKKKHSKHSKKGSKKSKSKDSPDKKKSSKKASTVDDKKPKEPKDSKTGDEKISSSIVGNVRKIEACKGATALASESTILGPNNYVVKSNKRIYQSEYSQVFPASNSTLLPEAKLVAKVVNLLECSPRFRANLLQTAVRIIRYCTALQPRSDLFIKTYDLYVVGGTKLFHFMDLCEPGRPLYDLIKSKDKSKCTAADVRRWTKAIAHAVDKLLRLGVAHRAVKLQHLLLDSENNVKLVGWSKSVLYYDAVKKRILMQHKERRTRQNYHLPPEAFQGSYDPSKADLWSIGVVLVAMCTKRYPFNVRNGKIKFSSQWREFTKKHELNTYVRNLCHQIFVINPKRRLTSKQVLKDKYFRVAEEKLAEHSCTADLKSMREDSRVGGMSAVDMPSSVAEAAPKRGKKSKKKPEEAAEEAEAEVEAPAEEDDPTGEYANATGMEGGNVGEEEYQYLDPAEQQFESQAGEMAAPEEAEEEANPVEGEEAAEEMLLEEYGADEEEEDTGEDEEGEEGGEDEAGDEEEEGGEEED